MLNKAQLIGFTGADAEIRTTPKGKKVAVLRVATSRYTKKGGERQDFTTWHQVEIWSPGTVSWLESRPLPKGSKVYVEGEIRNERFTGQDGQEHFFSKVVVAGPGHELKSLDRPETNPEDED
ncbi:single-stranded DNA-binding protein [Caulobacter soli]|uniref:single-stranded DNA-binding protein n=1 Tax=Caulobacter soli TaxID=2708539 RepID=UPI0013EB96BE|nr:single-stranded DNA-binding protein [Caulobacter soli]